MTTGSIGWFDRYLNLQFEYRYRLRNALGHMKFRPGNPRLDRPQFQAQSQLYRHIFEAAVTAKTRENIHLWVDVGSHLGVYLPEIAKTLPRLNHLLAIEADPYGRTLNGFQRVDYLLCALKRIPQPSEFRGGDFCTVTQVKLPKQAFVSFFFPFVSANPCQAWGLPFRFANFKRDLDHAKQFASLIFSVHQGTWERELAAEAYFEVFPNLKPSILEFKPVQFPKNWPGKYPVYSFVLSNF